LLGIVFREFSSEFRFWFIGTTCDRVIAFRPYLTVDGRAYQYGTGTW